MRIVEAEVSDAPELAYTVMEAVGMDLSEGFAGEHKLEEVKDLFTALSAREDSQYSWKNALKAIDDEGHPMGFIIGYDGARLYELRKAFMDLAKERLGYEFPGGLKDETDPSEFYLDSLAVYPQYRGQGVGAALINAMAQRAKSIGKPLGLLCDKTNDRARRLYEHLGFKKIGERPFAGEMMDHMMREA